MGGGVGKNVSVIYVERSPYSKILSLANMQLSFRGCQLGSEVLAEIAQMRRFLAKQVESGGMLIAKNIDIYSGGERHKAAFLRYENLHEDFDGFCINDLGVKTPSLLSNAKKD